MMKRYLFLLLVLPLSSSSAQDVVTGFGMGIGYYQMEELRSFNEYVANYVPFETKLIDDYPPFYYYHPSFALYWKRFEVGLAWSFHSSGSRYSSKDYSGEYLLDSKVKSSGPSTLFNICLNPSNKLRILFSNKIGMLSSNLVIEESLNVGVAKVFEESILFKSKDFFWEPGIKFEFPLSLFILEAHAGHFLQAKGKGFYKTDKGERVYLKNSGDEVHPEWNGFRIGLSALFNFTKFNHIGISSD